VILPIEETETRIYMVQPMDKTMALHQACHSQPQRLLTDERKARKLNNGAACAYISQTINILWQSPSPSPAIYTTRHQRPGSLLSHPTSTWSGNTSSCSACYLLNPSPPSQPQHPLPPFSSTSPSPCPDRVSSTSNTDP